MNHISVKVLSAEELQVGKKYVAEYNNVIRIAEVLDDRTARVSAEGALLESCAIYLNILNIRFLTELPEEKKQQSILDNPYYEVEAARLQGKTIQFKGYGGVWEDVQSAPSYFYPPEDYRIKPETKTVYRCRYEFEDKFGQSETCVWTSDNAHIEDMLKNHKRVHEGRDQFKKWIIEPECTPIEVEVK